jgi:hypothetical protein
MHARAAADGKTADLPAKATGLDATAASLTGTKE